MCRAVAAAIFGSAEKVKYVPLEPAKRFSTLQEGVVDMLASGTTYTLTRDTTLGLDFAGIYYFDTQAFMASRKLGKKSVRDITSATVCVQSGTTTMENVEDYFRSNNMTFRPVALNSADEMRVAFFAGQCNLFAADRSAVYATRAAYASNPNEYLILPESASREPLGLIVRQGDRPFAEVVRWSLYAMIQAEELGVTSRNVDEMLGSSQSQHQAASWRLPWHRRGPQDRRQSGRTTSSSRWVTTARAMIEMWARARRSISRAA